MTVPELVALTEGRWRARCQFCKVESVPVAAVDGTHAWGDLQALGWVVYESIPGAWPKALCEPCGVKNAEIMSAVKAAQKRRKRK